jgi:ferritin-like metal-binding protein YciE
MATNRPLKNLDDLFLHTFQDVYFAENAIVKALPLMARKASHASLKEGFETHLEETKEQIIRLNDVFKSLGEKASAPLS